MFVVLLLFVADRVFLAGFRSSGKIDSMDYWINHNSGRLQAVDFLVEYQVAVPG